MRKRSVAMLRGPGRAERQRCPPSTPVVRRVSEKAPTHQRPGDPISRKASDLDIQAACRYHRQARNDCRSLKSSSSCASYVGCFDET